MKNTTSSAERRQNDIAIYFIKKEYSLPNLLFQVSTEQ